MSGHSVYKNLKMKLFLQKNNNISRRRFSPYILKPDIHLLGQRSQPSVHAPSMGFSL